MFELSIIEKLFRINQWDNLAEYDITKKEILDILKKYRVPLSRIRCLFVDILEDIEDNNPTTI